MFFEFLKFVFYSGLIVVISKYILVRTLRKLAENLNLKSKTVGDIAGVATSVPELLTVAISSFSGLASASFFNIISSNVINLIQYIFAIFINKNQRILKNKAIAFDIVLVLITIAIPIFLLMYNISIDIFLVPAFFILYVLFKVLNNNAHKVYLEKEDEEIDEQVNKEKKWEKGNRKKTIKHVLILVFTGVLLFCVGDRLSGGLENLCNIFNIPETVIGILLGFVTSIPELITFFESQRHYKSNKSEDEVLGVVEATNNLLMSNILNLFVIQSIGILILTIF